MLNKVILVGRLTKDPELQKTSSGTSFLRFTIACDRVYSSKEEKKTDFITCVAWRQGAEFLANYARKGQIVGVDGNIQTGSYEKDGRTIYTTDIVCDQVRLIGPRPNGQEQQSTFTPSINPPTNDFDQSYESESYNLDDIKGDDLPF